MDLAQYKKAWKNQPEDKNKVSASDIYKMTQSKSTSIVKWIFIIGLMEFVILNSLVFFIDVNKAYQEYEKIGLKSFIVTSEIVMYIVGIGFLVMFYLNYCNINTVDSTKKLMSQILKTRRTVKLYVIFNLSCMFILLSVVAFFLIMSDIIDIPDNRLGLVIGIFIVAGLIALTLLWLFYQLLYGILLKKLRVNYKELNNSEKLS